MLYSTGTENHVRMQSYIYIHTHTHTNTHKHTRMYTTHTHTLINIENGCNSVKQTTFHQRFHQAAAEVTD